MAFSELFVCDACGHDAVLVHAGEWAPGSGGAIVPYSGRGKIGGLANHLWCHGCRSVRPHVFVRLEPPADHAVVAYAEAQAKGCDGRETGPCPECGAPLTWALDGQACPACANGVLRFTGEWEDAA